MSILCLIFYCILFLKGQKLGNYLGRDAFNDFIGKFKQYNIEQ